MIDEQAFQQVAQKLEALTDEMIAFQKSITAIPALAPENGGEGEWDRAMFIKTFLEKRGFSVEQIDAPDERAKNGKRPNLIVRLKGKDHSRSLWLMAHMDVVPEGERRLWHTDPWQVVVKDGKLYGRGTEDNQQGLTSAIFTIIAFKESGVVPEININVLLAADEETGSGYGLDYVLRTRPELFRKEDIIIVPDAGEPDGSMIEIAEKSILWLKFKTVGKQCHASTPEAGINAFKAGSHLVVALEKLYEIFDKHNEVFQPATSTFEPTMKEANVQNVNTIPGEDVFYLDCRVLPEYSLEAVKQAVREIADEVERQFNVQIHFEPVQELQAAPATPVDAPVVKRLQQGVKAVYQVEAKPMGIGGGTVAAFFRKAGLPVAVWSTLDDTCHQPNEYAVISNMVNDAKVFAHVALQK